MKNVNVKTGMKMGAIIGGLVFMVFGIVPGLYFGAFGTLFLLHQLAGPVDPNLFVRVAVVMGAAIGVLTSAIASVTVGGLIGSALGYAVSAPEIIKNRAASSKS